MAVRTDFIAGEVLAAQDLDDTFASKINYALPVNPQTGSGASAYTFVLADALRLTTASNASAGTYTIPPQSSVVWLANTVIRIVNYGAGVVTIAGGAGVTVTNATKTLAQFESAALIRTASNAWTLVPFSGTGNANFSDAATGTYTDGGIAYKYITYTGSGTLTVTRAGLADILLVGGGGGGGRERAGGGGAGAHHYITNVYLSESTHTVTIGAGGAGGTLTGGDNYDGRNGNTTRLGDYFAGGGGGGRGENFGNGQNGASGGGANGGGGTGTGGLGIGIVGVGNNGGNAVTNGPGGGGGAGAVGANGITGDGGDGGNGTANSITGSSITRAGGGGGGSTTGSSGGTGGGGAGSDTSVATAGSVNTGGGGGGNYGLNTGGAGGSGVVIIRVRT